MNLHSLFSANGLILLCYKPPLHRHFFTDTIDIMLCFGAGKWRVTQVRVSSSDGSDITEDLYTLNHKKIIKFAKVKSFFVFPIFTCVPVLKVFLRRPVNFCLGSS